MHDFLLPCALQLPLTRMLSTLCVDDSRRTRRLQDGHNGVTGHASRPTSPSAASDAPTASSASLLYAPAPTSALRSRMLWLFAPHAADCPWALVVRTLAHVALHASNDAVAEQGVEEAMRLLHKHVQFWDGETLASVVAAAHASLFAGELVPCVHEGAPVVLNPRDLERLLGRFHTYLPSLWTLLIAEYGALGAPTLRRLLDSLLVLLHVERMDVVRAGVAALHQMSIVVAGNGGAELDHAGWTAFADMLQRACSMDTVTALPAQQRYQTVQLVQRSIAQILQHCGRCMPPEVHLDVLGVLQASVQRAASACSDGSALEALWRDVRSADSGADERGAREAVHHGHDGHAHVGMHTVLTSAAQHDMPVASRAHDLAAAGNTANIASAGVGNGVAGHDRPVNVTSCAPAMQRAMCLLREQQNHGGTLLVKAYRSTIELFRESAARHTALVEARDCTATAQGRMVKFSHQVVDACLACCQQRDAESEYGTSVAERREACAWSPIDNAPVLCAVLRALAAQQGGGKQGWASDMMPSLCVLMRSGDGDVRDVIADIFDSVVWPQLENAL